MVIMLGCFCHYMLYTNLNLSHCTEKKIMRVRTTKVTQLLGQTPFRAPDIQAPFPPEERCLPGRAPTAGAGEGAILGPRSLKNQFAQVSLLTAKGEQSDCRSDTASGTDPVSGSRHPGTFPARGEVSPGGL